MLAVRASFRLAMKGTSYRPIMGLTGHYRVHSCHLPFRPNSQVHLSSCFRPEFYRSLTTKAPRTPPSEHPDGSASLASDDESSDDYSSEDELSSDDESDEPEGMLPFGKRGASKLWLSKMRTYHRVMDVNKDGTVSWDDFQVMADKFSQLGHLDQQQQQEFAKQLRLVWEDNWGATDDPYCFITEESLVTSMQHVVNTPELCRKVHHFLPYLFKAVDYNSSGDISIDEYILLFKCLGLSEKNAVISFESIDSNNSGTITLDEFVRSGRDFFLSENENDPSQKFWGPLFG